MTSGTLSRLRRIYGIALSCVIILAGLCLMIACAGIYFSGGEEPYSREAVAAAFSPIAIPVYLCLFMVLAGFLMRLFFPVPAEKVQPLKQHSVQLKRALSRADLEASSEDLRQQIRAEQTRRKKQSAVCGVLLAVLALVFLSYALNGSHFHSSDINGSMIRAMWVLVPCLAAAIVICIFTVRSRCASMSRETELLKQCPRKAAAEEKAPAASPKAKYVLLAVSIALLLFGFFTGGTADVLTKAVNICTECIGLG